MPRVTRLRVGLLSLGLLAGCSPPEEAPAPIPRTGQVDCYGEDGSLINCGVGDLWASVSSPAAGTELQRGKAHQYPGVGQDAAEFKGVSWPTPRFTKNNDGTVTDNLTGLVWLADANCFGTLGWLMALGAASALHDSGTPVPTDDCGLSEGSIAGQWRLANVREMSSLIHFGFEDPAIPNTAGTGPWAWDDPFTDVRADNEYWTSTSSVNNGLGAWNVQARSGGVQLESKTELNYVWAVRDPTPAP